MTIGIWTIRNYYVTGRFIPVASGVSANLYVGNNLETNGLWMGKVYYQKLYKDLGVDNDINKRNELIHKMAIENIKNNLKYRRWAYIKLLFIKKPIRMWDTTNGGYFGFPNRFKEDIRYRNYVTIIVKSISLFVYLSLLIFAVVVFFCRFKSTWKKKLIFISIPIYFTALIIPILAIPRYAVPAYPFIFVLSAVAIDSIFRKGSNVV